MKKQKNSTENGKSVFVSAQIEQNQKGKVKLHASETANEIVSLPNWQKAVYNAMCETELQPITTALRLSELLPLSDKAKLQKINETIRENAETAHANKTQLLKVAFNALKHYAFATAEERKLAFAKVRKVWNLTAKFSVTFQNESTPETTTTYESGAYFGKPTRYTASGLQTCFNSADIARVAVARKAKIQQAESARAKLATIDTASILAQLSASELARLAEKLQK